MADTTGPWSVTVTFTADEPDTAHMLRELLHTMAEGYRGVTDVDVEATHPDRFAWFNPSGNPGDGRLLDLDAIP